VTENERPSSEESPTPKKPSAKMILVLVAIGVGFALLIVANMN